MYKEEKYAEYAYIGELISRMEAYVINKQMSGKLKDKMKAKTMRKALKWARECREALDIDINSVMECENEDKQLTNENAFCEMYNPVHPTGSWCKGSAGKCNNCIMWIGNRKELEG